MNTPELDFSTIYLIKSLANLPDEMWKPIMGFEELYEISSLGRVKSLRRNQFCYFAGGVLTSNKVRIMKYSMLKGYVLASLTKDGEETKSLVHRLVGFHYVNNPLPDVYDTVDHISTIKTQNNYQNLRWTTRSQNTVYAQELGIFGNLYKPKFNKEQVLSIFNDTRGIDELSDLYNVHRSTIHLIKCGKNYSRFTGKKYVRTNNATLSSGLILDIFNSSGTLDHVAGIFNIDRSVVHRIRTGRSYSSITGKTYIHARHK